MKKKPRTTTEFRSTNKICAVRCVDIKLVTLASNNLTHEPLKNVIRYCRQKNERLNQF